jgi:cob(I)alamin adenosyltransferase
VWLHVSTGIGTVFSTVKSQRRSPNNTKYFASVKEVDYLNKYHITGHQECEMCTETEQFLDGTSEICTVHRNRTLSRRCIRHMYCAHQQNTFQTVHQQRVLGTPTEHFPDGTSEKCIVHRNRTLSRRYIRHMYCAQKQNTFQTVHQTCTVHTNRTLSRRYIGNVYCAQK